MKIANPIYDSVFKFMMNDNKVARLLLSAILGEEIVHLDFRPTEVNIPLNEALTILRMDFSALVRYKNGEEQLIILEVQKAKMHTDIMRFRRYLGEQYSSSVNGKEIKTQLGTKRKKAFPIVSIYFLGHSLDNTEGIPVIKVARHYINYSTGEIIEQKEEFIESLTHDSYIIQIPFLKGQRRTELEQVLSIFDQSNHDKDFHILNVKEEDLPQKYRPIIRRLIMAIADAQLRNEMKVEDDIIKEFRGHIEALREKEVELQNKEQELQSKDEELQSKNKTLANVILNLHHSEMPVQQISQLMDMSIEEIQKIIDSQ